MTGAIFVHVWARARPPEEASEPSRAGSADGDDEEVVELAASGAAQGRLLDADVIGASHEVVRVALDGGRARAVDQRAEAAAAVVVEAEVRARRAHQVDLAVDPVRLARLREGTFDDLGAH